jgi:hypothetical protein
VEETTQTPKTIYVIQFFNGNEPCHSVYRRPTADEAAERARVERLYETQTPELYIHVWGEEKVRVIEAQTNLPRVPVPEDFNLGMRNAFSTYAIEL